MYINPANFPFVISTFSMIGKTDLMSVVTFLILYVDCSYPKEKEKISAKSFISLKSLMKLNDLLFSNFSSILNCIFKSILFNVVKVFIKQFNINHKMYCIVHTELY